jgi:hypothetical protein
MRSEGWARSARPRKSVVTSEWQQGRISAPTQPQGSSRTRGSCPLARLPKYFGRIAPVAATAGGASHG